jgi:hypothetical protein
MIILLTTSLMVTSWHDCWFQIARSVQSGDHFLQAEFPGLIRTMPSRITSGATGVITLRLEEAT